MALTPWEELLASARDAEKPGPLSPSEEVEMLEAEKDGVCPCCKRPLNAIMSVPAPF